MKSTLANGLIRTDGLDFCGPRLLKVVSEPISVKEIPTGGKRPSSGLQRKERNGSPLESSLSHHIQVSRIREGPRTSSFDVETAWARDPVTSGGDQNT